MLHLLIVSLVWAASFGLIRTHLVGVDPDLVNAIRLGLAAAVFLPFLAGGRMRPRLVATCLGIGAVQFACMYALYTRSYALLQAHQVALATIMTPVYVVLLADALDRRLPWMHLLYAGLAVLGTAICLGVGALDGAAWHGLLLVQAANLCFAIGQVWYRRTAARESGLADRHAFAWCALGAACGAGLFALPALAGKGGPVLSAVQWGVLAYLGVVASGLCFFLWNRGARQVETGVLAVMNDLKIPLGVLASLLLFGERAHWERLLAGGAVIAAAWWLAVRGGRRAA